MFSVTCKLFCGKNDALRDIASFQVVRRLGHHFCAVRDLLQFLPPGIFIENPRREGDKVLPKQKRALLPLGLVFEH